MNFKRAKFFAGIIFIIFLAIGITLKKTYFKTADSLQTEIKKSNPNNVMVFAHRGMLYHNPEHSFAGYDENIKDGATIIEQDVHITKDNVLIVSHDENLKRVTGHNVSITKSNYSHIKNIKLRNGEKVHTLDEVLGRYKNKVNYAIEAKRELQNDYHLEHKIAETVNKHGLAKNTLIQDADLNGLIAIHKERSFDNVPTLWLENDKSFSKNYKKDIEKVPGYITFVGIPLNKATPNIVNYIHNKKHLVNTWTLTNYDDNAKAKDLKVDSVFTNDAKFTLRYFKNSF